MKLALSNFAWDFPELENISKVLNETGIEYVEVVFSKYCDWNDITTEKVTELTKELFNSNGGNKISGVYIYGDYPPLDFRSEDVINSEFISFNNFFKSRLLRSKILFP